MLDPPLADRQLALLQDALGADGPLALRAIAPGRWLAWAGDAAWDLEIERRTPWTGSGLLRRLAAAMALSLVDAPVGPREPVLVRHDLDGVGVIARSHDGELDGAQRLSLDPTAHAAVARDVGRVLAVLEEALAPRPALGVSGPRFVPTARDLPSAIVDRAARALALARRVGIDPGPLGGRLLAAVTELAHADAHPPVLSHGHLGASVLTYARQTDRVAHARVIDWSSAAAAPPSRDRAALVDLPPSTLAAVLDGYGRERAAAWRDDLDALRLWHRLRALERFAWIADGVLAGDAGAAELLEHATLLAERALDPRCVAAALDAALSAEIAPVAVPGLRPDPRKAKLRRTLADGARLAHAPPALAQAWASGLAADLLLLETPGEARGERIGVGEVAELVRERLLEARALPDAEAPPIADRDGFWEALRAAVAARGDDRALVVLMTVRDAVDALGGAVSDSTLRAAEAAIWALVGAGVPFEQDGPRARLGRAALALAAVSGSAAAPEQIERVESAADALDLLGGHADATDIPALLAAMSTAPAQALLAPLLARALRRVALPVDVADLAANAEW